MTAIQLQSGAFTRLSDALVGQIASFVCEDGRTTTEHARLAQVCKRFREQAGKWKKGDYAQRLAGQFAFTAMPITPPDDGISITRLLGLQGKFFGVTGGRITMYDWLTLQEKQVGHANIPYLNIADTDSCCLVNGKLAYSSHLGVNLWSLRTGGLLGRYGIDPSRYINLGIERGQVMLERIEDHALGFFDLSDGSLKEQYTLDQRGHMARSADRMFSLSRDHENPNLFILTVFDRETNLVCHRVTLPANNAFSLSYYKGYLIEGNAQGIRLIDARTFETEQISIPIGEEQEGPIDSRPISPPFFFGELYFYPARHALYIFNLQQRAHINTVRALEGKQFIGAQFVDGELTLLQRNGGGVVFEWGVILQCVDFKAQRNTQAPAPLPEIQGGENYVEVDLELREEVVEEEPHCCLQCFDYICCFLTYLFYPFVALYRCLCTDE